MGSSWIRYNFLSLFLFLNTKNTQMIYVAIERRSRPRDSLSFPQLLIWPMGLGGGGGPGLGRSDPNFGSFVLGCTEADFYENTCSHLKHFRDLKYLHTFACSVVFLHIQKRLFGVIPQTFCLCDYIFEYLKKISEIPQNTTNFSSKFIFCFFVQIFWVRPNVLRPSVRPFKMYWFIFELPFVFFPPGTRNQLQ